MFSLQNTETIQIMLLILGVIHFCIICLSSVSVSVSLQCSYRPRRALRSIPATDQSLSLMSTLTLEQRSSPDRTPPLIVQ